MTVYNDISEKYQIGFQEEVTPAMIGIRDLQDNIMYYIIIIITLVTYLIIKMVKDMKKDIIYKYITHSTIVEVVWTIIPSLILISIAIPSFKLLYSLDEVLSPLLTLKVTGNQWYWHYNISDFEGLDIDFDSYLIPESDLTNGPRLLDVDNKVYLPILTPIRLLVSSDDVIHSFAVPSLGIKVDAIPGRINQSSIYLLREGLFYGNCTELCGTGHAYMPIAIKGVNYSEFFAWLFTFSNISFNSFASTIQSLKSYLF